MSTNMNLMNMSEMSLQELELLEEKHSIDHDKRYHDILINLYYKRDCVMGLNQKKHINNSLSKLGYLNINTDDEINKHIARLFDSATFLGNPDMSFNDFKKSYMEGKDFTDYMYKLYSRMNRSMVLSKYIDTDDTKSFYKSCTIHELCCLGY
jgi:hypothetical protein